MSLFEDTQHDHPTSPRQFTVVRISAHEACALNEQWHSRLPLIHPSNVIRNRHYVCFAAVYCGDPYAVGIWSSPVAANRMKNGEQILELRRLAICNDAPRNTATWMLAAMQRDIFNLFPDISLLVSYQDTEVHHGTIYKAANWVPTVRSEGQSWGVTRQRNADQTTAPKIRWEFRIRPELPPPPPKPAAPIEPSLFDEAFA